MSNRFWLSLCAFTFGAMTMLTGISLGPALRVSFDSFSSMQLVFFQIFLVAPLIYWLYIFFRPRGMRVILSSRPHLSASALLFGELLVLSMLSLKKIEPVDFTVISIAGLVLIILGIAVPMAAWFILFSRCAKPAAPRETGA